MSRHQQAFKSTQVFDWASEPKDERPTDFGSSTGFSALSGYYALPETSTRDRRQRREHKQGFAKLVVASAFILGLSVFLMYEVIRFLKV